MYQENHRVCIVFSVLNTDFTTLWSFFAGVDTIENRFVDAVNNGIGVQWTVDFNGLGYGYTGDWEFSDSALDSQRGTPWQQGSGNSFSDDDGIWGAANGSVNGNTDTPPVWGQGVINAGDGDCSDVYINGTAYQSNQVKNLMYFR